MHRVQAEINIDLFKVGKRCVPCDVGSLEIGVVKLEGLDGPRGFDRLHPLDFQLFKVSF